jgi:hypothetical protein
LLEEEGGEEEHGPSSQIRQVRRNGLSYIVRSYFLLDWGTRLNWTPSPRSWEISEPPENSYCSTQKNAHLPLLRSPGPAEEKEIARSF